MVYAYDSWTNDTQLVDSLILHIQNIVQMQEAKELCVTKRIGAWQDECAAIISNLHDGVDLLFRCRWDIVEIHSLDHSTS